MDEGWSRTLLAISYDVIPELREQRDRYYDFWNAIGAVAIIGWIAVLLLYRIRTPNQPSLRLLVAGAVLIGGGLGWALWSRLERWSWGDIGVASRWLGEMTACILGGVAWLLVGCWLLLYRR